MLQQACTQAGMLAGRHAHRHTLRLILGTSGLTLPPAPPPSPSHLPLLPHRHRHRRRQPQSGLVTHRKMSANLTAERARVLNVTCHPFPPAFKQLVMYQLCALDHGHRHQWMAFIDVDEFLVFTRAEDAAVDDLPALLREYEGHGGLAVSWRLFGSGTQRRVWAAGRTPSRPPWLRLIARPLSYHTDQNPPPSLRTHAGGHAQRQPDTLLSYTRCYDYEERENLHVKTIANMAHFGRIETPHNALYAPGYSAVTTTGKRVESPWAAKPVYSRLSLHHYVTKSREDYESKMSRGNVMNDGGKGEAFWKRTEARWVRGAGCGMRGAGCGVRGVGWGEGGGGGGGEGLMC